MMKNIFVPFAITQALLLAWTHFNWDSGGLSEMQAVTIANVVVLATLAGAWRALPHTKWTQPLVAGFLLCQSGFLIALKGMGVIDWQTMVPLFIAGQVLMILYTRTSIAPATPANPTSPSAPADEQTTGG